MELGENHFTVMDYIVVLVTLIGSLGIGVFFALKKQTTEDLLVGGRTMGPLPIAASMLATYLSAIAILGYPSEIYYHGIEIYTMSLMQLIFAPLAAYIIVPLLYHLKLTSVFEYLECRYDSIVSRWIGACIGISQVFFFMGVILFAPSIALEHIVGIPYWLSIVGIGLCGTAYTAVGGLKAVVWTDVFQLIIIFVSLAAIILSKAFSSEGGLGDAFSAASKHGRLTLLNFNIDPFMRHNTFNFLVGFGFSTFCMTAMHQPQVQRYSALPSLQIAQKAILVTIPMSIITMGLLVVTGIVIFGHYAGCDPMKSRKIRMPDQIVPFYIVTELSMIPGMLGMFISCIFSAVLSTVSSALNSAAAVTWQDFLVSIPYFAKMSDKTKANCTRIIAAMYGVVTIGFAFGVQNLGTSVLPLTLSIVGAASGPTGATFLLGMFVPWVNKYGANSGMVVGIGTMFYFSIKAFQLGVQHIPLATSIAECPAGSIVARNITRAMITKRVVDDIEWPEKMFATSYLLFPILGALITTVVSLTVSGLSGGFCSARNVDPKYLHPWVRNSSCIDPNGGNSKTFRATPVKSRNSADIILSANGAKPTSPTFAYGPKTYRYEPVPTELVPMRRSSSYEETVGDSIPNKS